MAVAAPSNNLSHPVHTPSPVDWIRRNLLASPLQISLTLLVLWLLYWVVPPLVRWALIDASWIGETRRDCTGDGACWVFIRVRLDNIPQTHYLCFFVEVVYDGNICLMK